MSKQFTFVVNDETAQIIDELKKSLDVATASGVFKKALMLASLASKNADQGVFTFTGKDQAPKSVILRG